MNNKKINLRPLGFLLCVFIFCPLLKAAEQLPSLERVQYPFEREITAYETKFRENPPIENSTMFVGSSTWTLWSKQLEEDFSKLQAVNVGFGGATIPDLLRAADRIVIPHKPKRILFFCGGNDIARKMKSDEVAGNFRKYLSKIWAADPFCEIYFVSVSHAPVRKADWPETGQLNDEIKKLAEKLDGLYFIDIRPAMNDENGETREDLFLADRLHLNRDAQKIWIPIILDAVKSGDELKNVTENPEKTKKQREEML